MNTIQLWSPYHIQRPDISDISSAMDLVPETNLSQFQTQQIVAAYKAQAYDMACEYTWAKSMIKLKEIIGGLGNDLVQSILQRNDIDQYSDLVSLLSDSEAIMIAENIGLLDREAAMKLRQAKESLTYYFSTEAAQKDACLNAIDSLKIISDCVSSILSFSANIQTLEFNSFTKQLLNNTIESDSDFYDKICHSSVFYLRTVCHILINSISNDTGATFEHACSNLNTILPSIWDKLPEDSKWEIGNAYNESVSNGKVHSSKYLKAALSSPRVKGFDYVPETLRSNTFIMAAKNVLNAHYGFNNFYNEPPAVNKLASLGTIIPKNAFRICMTAYICVSMGNAYNISIDAERIASNELKKVDNSRFIAYIDKMLCTDEDVLNHINTENQISRLGNLLLLKGIDSDSISNPDIKSLIDAVVNKRSSVAKQIANKIITKNRDN